MASFFIDTATGQVATQRQLVEGGIARSDQPPPRPWHPVHGSRDASTMWFAVMRKRTKGVYIGTLTLRHGHHHASLLAQGWEEVPYDQIGIGDAARAQPGSDDSRGAGASTDDRRLPAQEM